jgi:hypothetical protein
MTYAYDDGNGQRLLVENDGDDTRAALSSGDSGRDVSNKQPAIGRLC